MAAINFKNDIDLNQNKIIQVRIDPRAAAPGSPKSGQFYFNETDGFVYYHNSTKWIKVVAVNGREGIEEVELNGEIFLDVKTDNVTLEIDANNQVIIKDQGVSTAKIKDANVTTVKVLDKNITFSKIQDMVAMTILGSIAGGTPEELQLLDDATLSDTGISTSTTRAIKSYVDDLVAGIGSLQGGFDAATSGAFPSPSDKADFWYTTAAGTVNGIKLEVGDVLIANKDNASTANPNDWIFLQTNRDKATTTVLGMVKIATNAMVDADTMTDNETVITPQLLERVQAKETKRGMAKIATQAQTDAGTDDTTIVTPLKLKAFYDAKSGGYVALIGNGAATSFNVGHAADTTDVMIQTFEVATGQRVFVSEKSVSTTTVNVEFGVDNVPGNNAYKVLIKKVA